MSTSATIVSSTPPAAAATPAAAAQPQTDAAAWQAKIDALTKQINDSKEETAEATRTAKYWADKAKADKATEKTAKAADDEDVDVLETITTKGAKGFDELAAKRGFIRRDEVNDLIESKATALTKEQELIGRFPDLKKRDSEFFKTTSLHYGELVKSGTPQALAMELAAEKAELEFIKTGKMKIPGAEPTKEEKEAARLARIRAQAGDGGDRRPAASEEEEGELTDQQKHIARSMGITEEAYAKRAKAGVSMKGIR